MARTATESANADDAKANRFPLDADAADDPRIEQGRLYHCASDGAGDVTLVGVVHDHPASVHRARTLVAELTPAVVALELSPIALPLFEEYAADERTPPAFGGEMSAAAQAATEVGADVVGVDAPNGTFLRLLARRLVREDVPLEAVRRLAAGVSHVTRHALACWVAAALAARTSLRIEVDAPVAHDCTRADPPEVQAADEDRQVARSRSLLGAIETPLPMRLRDETRETAMARRLADLRERGDVVAVVGVDHLDGVADALEEA